jgi:hypothetical protein
MPITGEFYILKYLNQSSACTKEEIYNYVISKMPITPFFNHEFSNLERIKAIEATQIRRKVTSGVATTQLLQYIITESGKKIYEELLKKLEGEERASSPKLPFRKDVNTEDRLFLYNDINESNLLYILSKKGAIIDITKVYAHPDIDSKRKEKILTGIGELIDKGYAKEISNTTVNITLRGKWRRVYTHPLGVFIGVVFAGIAIFAAYHIAAMSTQPTPITTKKEKPAQAKDSTYQKDTARTSNKSSN